MAMRGTLLRDRCGRRGCATSSPGLAPLRSASTEPPAAAVRAPAQPCSRRVPAVREWSDQSRVDAILRQIHDNGAMHAPAIEELVTANRILAREGIVDAF